MHDMAYASISFINFSVSIADLAYFIWVLHETSRIAEYALRSIAVVAYFWFHFYQSNPFTHRTLFSMLHRE